MIFRAVAGQTTRHNYAYQYCRDSNGFSGSRNGPTGDPEPSISVISSIAGNFAGGILRMGVGSSGHESVAPCKRGSCPVIGPICPFIFICIYSEIYCLIAKISGRTPLETDPSFRPTDNAIDDVMRRRRAVSLGGARIARALATTRRERKKSCWRRPATRFSITATAGRAPTRSLHPRVHIP